MNILAIDTSSSWLTIVCGDQTAIRGAFSENIGNQHSEKLVGAVKQLLDESKIQLQDIGLISVVTGPGSFTGLRVGISFTKGLAMALGIKTIGLNTLDALARAAFSMKVKNVSPMIDARKGQVYAALYDVGKGARSLISEYAVRSPFDWLKDLPKDTVVLGSGVETYRDLIANDHKQPVLLEKNIVTISSECLYECSKNASIEGKTLAPEELDAFYIRQADAVCKPKKL